MAPCVRELLALVDDYDRHCRRASPFERGDVDDVDYGALFSLAVASDVDDGRRVQVVAGVIADGQC